MAYVVTPPSPADIDRALRFEADTLAKKERNRQRRVKAGLIGSGLLMLAADYLGIKAISEIDPVRDEISADKKTIRREIDTRVFTDVTMTAEIAPDGTTGEFIDSGVSGFSDTTMLVAALGGVNLAAAVGARAYYRGQRGSTPPVAPQPVVAGGTPPPPPPFTAPTAAVVTP